MILLHNSVELSLSELIPEVYRRLQYRYDRNRSTTIVPKDTIFIDYLSLMGLNPDNSDVVQDNEVRMNLFLTRLGAHRYVSYYTYYAENIINGRREICIEHLRTPNPNHGVCEFIEIRECFAHNGEFKGYVVTAGRHLKELLFARAESLHTHC